jgi:hypothetical protein
VAAGLQIVKHPPDRQEDPIGFPLSVGLLIPADEVVDITHREFSHSSSPSSVKESLSFSMAYSGISHKISPRFFGNIDLTY